MRCHQARRVTRQTHGIASVQLTNRLAAVDPGLVTSLNPMLLKNTGGSIWLEACEPEMESVS